MIEGVCEVFAFLWGAGDFFAIQFLHGLKVGHIGKSLAL
jgi:hypothetical protein